MHNKRSLLSTLAHEKKPNENASNVKVRFLVVFVTLFSNGSNECAFSWRLKHLKFSQI